MYNGNYEVASLVYIYIYVYVCSKSIFSPVIFATKALGKQRPLRHHRSASPFKKELQYFSIFSVSEVANLYLNIHLYLGY